MELVLLHSLPYQREYLSFPVELAAKIAVRIVARILQENPGHFDLVEWVLFDSYTESVYEAEVDKKTCKTMQICYNKAEPWEGMGNALIQIFHLRD